MKNRLEDFIQFLSKILEKEIPNSDELPTGITYLQIIERTNYSLLAINRLLDSNDYKYSHALNLICRNILTDYILIMYIQVKFNSNSEEIKCFLLSIYNDEFDRLQKTIESKVYISRSEDFNIMFNNPKDRLYQIKNIIKHYNNKIPEYKSTIAMYNVLVNNHGSNTLTQEVIEAYGIWMKLSKSEHIGWFSFEFSRTLNIEEMKSLINIVLKKSINMIIFILPYFKEDINDLYDLLN